MTQSYLCQNRAEHFQSEKTPQDVRPRKKFKGGLFAESSGIKNEKLSALLKIKLPAFFPAL
jgi:hypothetical protein